MFSRCKVSFICCTKCTSRHERRRYLHLQPSVSGPHLTMLGKASLVILSIAVAASHAVNRGSIQVEGYGEIWVISPDWANVQVNSGGNSFTLHGNSRMYFASRPTDGFEADAYWQVRSEEDSPHTLSSFLCL